MARQASKGTDSRKISSELFALTYGSIVSQMVEDYEVDDEVNKQLDKMGYNIGIRLVEDFLARSGIGRCNDFRETADTLSKGAFKMYLGIQPTVTNWSLKGDEFSLVFENNPLTEFVELPETHANLDYSNVLCGAIRGALEMVQLDVSVWFVQDQLKGAPCSEIRVKFIKRLEDALPPGED